MTPERAHLERAISELISSAHLLSHACDTLERRALDAEAEARVLRERVEMMEEMR